MIIQCLDIFIFGVNCNRPKHDICRSGEVQDFFVNIQHPDFTATTTCCPIQCNLKFLVWFLFLFFHADTVTNATKECCSLPIINLSFFNIEIVEELA